MKAPLAELPFFRSPDRARFELTNICNLRCKMCGIWQDRPNIRIEPEQFETLMGQKTLRYLRVISLTGGEPFALRNLEAYYRIARRSRQRAHINISTNGFYTERTLEFLAGTRPRNLSITISYDGILSHDAIRRVDGSAERLLETGRQVKKRFPEIVLSMKMTVTNDNHAEILDTAEQCKALNIPFRFKTLEKLVCHQGRHPSEISGPEYDGEIIESITRQAREVLSLGIETNTAYLNQLIRMNTGERVSCNCSTRTLFIGVDGKVFLCRRKPAIGDLTRQTLDEIWTSNERETRLEQMRSCEESILSLSYTND
jgi:MoaA/NifB/PqqE/SkfB family radical SAM enzyme